LDKAFASAELVAISPLRIVATEQRDYRCYTRISTRQLPQRRGESSVIYKAEFQRLRNSVPTKVRTWAKWRRLDMSKIADPIIPNWGGVIWEGVAIHDSKVE
jgi:hypothetical protein